MAFDRAAKRPSLTGGPARSAAGMPTNQAARPRSLLSRLLRRLIPGPLRRPLRRLIPGRAAFALLLLGLALRLFFITHNPDLTGDPLLYGAIARNLLEHGIYGFSPTVPTLIRLPGYPFFLAACFAVFGVERYDAVLYLQAALDLGTCLLLARLAARLAPPAFQRTTALATLALSTLCPFLACYTAAPLTETLELFSITLALYAFARTLASAHAHDHDHVVERRVSAGWLATSAAAWTLAALLRPDGALLGVVLCPALVFYAGRERPRALRLAAVAALASLLTFAPWAARNWYTFHVFEPLAPRYATDPGEATNPGFQRWTKTICVDLVCTAEVYWAADDAPITLDQLPSRAFDSPEQLRTTADLLADYNRTTTMTPALDARFARLAAQRLHAHPWRTRLGLPLARLADMWFRPRVELFNIDLRWWHYRSEGPDTLLAWALGLLNLAYLGLGCAGARLRPPLLGVFAAFVLLRCALLLTIEAPEPRYTLECFPVVLLLGGLALGRLQRRTTS